MADTYLEDQLDSSPPWLRQPLGAAWARAFGSQKDWLADIAKQAVKARMAGTVAPVVRRTNLLAFSQQFDLWQAGTATHVAPNVATAPDGTFTADKLVEEVGAASQHYCTKFAPVGMLGANEIATASAFLKAAERTYAVIALQTRQPNWPLIVVNLSTGAIVSAIPGGYTAGVLPAGNGFWRFFITGSVSTGPNEPAVVVYIATSDVGAPQSYVGDGTSGIYLWGGQLERGSLTSHIPTGASPVTVEDFTPIAPADALPRIGEERGLPRGLVESEADFRRRLVAAWEIWQWAGTAFGMLRALRLAGYPAVTIQTQSGKQYSLTATDTGTVEDLIVSDLPAPVHLGGLPAELWSDLSVLIVEPWPDRWNGVAPADGSNEQKTVAALVAQWKGAHNRCVRLQAQKGPIVGTPGLLVGGFTVGAGTLVAWTPPAG